MSFEVAFGTVIGMLLAIFIAFLPAFLHRGLYGKWSVPIAICCAVLWVFSLASKGIAPFVFFFFILWIVLAVIACIPRGENAPQVPPRSDDISSRNRPLRYRPVTTVIVGLTFIGLFLSMAFDSFPELFWLSKFGLSKTNVWNNPLRLILYAIPHADIMHWLTYSIPLAVCGWLIEPKLGSGRTLGVGCLGCIIYGLCHLFLGNGGMLIGSGGIASGLVGALAGYSIHLRKQLQRSQIMTYSTLVVVFCLLMLSFTQNTSLVVAQICAMISGVVAVMARRSAGRRVVPS